MIRLNVIGLEDVDSGNLNVGSKALRLSEVVRNRIPVPRGFVITSEAYQSFLRFNRMEEKLEGMVSGPDPEDIGRLIETSKAIRGMFVNSRIPESLEKEISRAYNRMFVSMEAKEVGGAALDFIKAGREQVSVAVRASPFAGNGSSFPGVCDSFLNVGGMKGLLEHIKACWSSAFSPKALYYAIKKGKDPRKGMGVIIQKMVNSEKSGGASFLGDRVVIEGAWGLGKSLSEGSVSPDRYFLDPETGDVSGKTVGNKTYMYSKDPVSGKTKKLPVLKERVSSELLDGEEISSIFKILRRIREVFGNSISVDWALERGKLHVIQARPMSWSPPESEEDGEIKGFGVSPGTGRGTLKVLESLSDFSGVTPEDIIITRNMNPDLSLLMGKAGGIISSGGGLFSNVSSMAREFGTACIVGIDTGPLEPGKMVRIDGAAGALSYDRPEEPPSPDGYEIVDSGAPSATEVFMNMDFRYEFDPDQDFDGIGVLDPSGLFGESDPLFMLRSSPGEFESALRRVEGVAESASPRMVWYRLLSPRQEGERNPMLGCRGMRMVLENQELFGKEIEIIKKMYEKGIQNVGIVLPFVTSVKELRIMKDVVPSYLKTGVEISVPSAALEMETFVNEGVDFVLINLSELSRLTLGVDPSNPRVSTLYTESSRAVMKLIKMVVEACRGQADVSVLMRGYDQITVERLFDAGVDSMSFDPEFVEQGKNEISRLEKKFLLDRMRTRGATSSSFP